METIDWATLQIIETHDDEGRIEIMSENQMCALLGIFDEADQIYLDKAVIVEWMNKTMLMTLGKILMVLSFLLTMMYLVRCLSVFCTPANKYARLSYGWYTEGHKDLDWFGPPGG